MNKGIKSYPPLADRLRPPVNVPDEVKVQFPLVELKGFKEKELNKVSENIFLAYKNYYGEEYTKKLKMYLSDIIKIKLDEAELLDSVNPRDYNRSLVACLDMVRLNPNKFNSKEEIINLFENIKEMSDIDDW